MHLLKFLKSVMSSEIVTLIKLITIFCCKNLERLCWRISGDSRFEPQVPIHPSTEYLNRKILLRRLLGLSKLSKYILLELLFYSLVIVKQHH